MKLRNCLALGLMWTATQLCTVLSPLEAWEYTGLEPDIILDVSGGWRNDNIDNENHIVLIDGTYLETEKEGVRSIELWQIGGKGRFSFCNVFIKGWGYYGWVDHGKFFQKIKGTPVHLDGRVHKGHTIDGLIGAGYLFPFEDCYGNVWGIGPVAGWSTNEKVLRVSHLEERFKHERRNGKKGTTVTPIEGSIKIKDKWTGPFLGAEVSFIANDDVVVFAGYEYHWANLHNSLRETLTDTSFIERRKSHRGYGNVAYFDAKYVLCSNWTVGLGLRFQSFRTKKGHIEISTLGVHEELKRTKWHSSAVTLDLGYIY